LLEKVSALLERQSHWFKVALPSKTAVPLVFDLARRRDLLRRADTQLDSNSVSKVTSIKVVFLKPNTFIINLLQRVKNHSSKTISGNSLACVLISYLRVPPSGKRILLL